MADKKHTVTVDDAGFARVSVHGGHSGSFCGHATDTLADVVARYAATGFEWVCLTEHMIGNNEALLPPEEAASGLSLASLQKRFDDYFREARALQIKWAGQLEIFVGFETEAYTGYEVVVSELIKRHAPDLLVGSVHHMHDLLFDDKLADYQQAARLSGGINQLYCDYFDRQLELIERFQPAVVGHFDLIRIHDPDYRDRWEVPAVRDRGYRNLQRIKELGLILDLNVRALTKGAAEPYISAPFMAFAIREGVLMTTGDDSHGVASVGVGLEDGVAILKARGGSTNWAKPEPGRHVA